MSETLRFEEFLLPISTVLNGAGVTNIDDVVNIEALIGRYIREGIWSPFSRNARSS